MEEIVVPKMSRIKVFFRPLSVKILSVAVAVLLIAVSCLTVLLVKKHNTAVKASVQITKNEQLLDKANSEITEIKAQLENEQNSNAQLQGQLQTKEQEKKQLEEKIKGLQSEIELLKAKKASGNKGSSTVKPVTYPSVPVPLANNGPKVCYLTFDDGPSKNTLQIIKTLNTYGIKATFFVTNTGTNAYMKDIVNSGNAIGLHTSSHKYDLIYKNVDAYFADLQKISDSVEAITGVKSFVMRFPGGSSNVVSKKYCKGIMTTLSAKVQEKGYGYFDWNVDSGDANRSRPSVNYIVNNVLNGAGNKNSICVLMHDSAAKGTTAQALPRIIEGLAAKGYRFEVLTTDVKGFHHGINN
ncbi:MAG: polysaccharide deacetylase family protein [Clostridia bacterium]|nr:polysaccharide deacetylase family protein [Clostridia bacterium]